MRRRPSAAFLTKVMRMKKSDRLKPKKKRNYRAKNEPIYTFAVRSRQLGDAKKILGMR